MIRPASSTKVTLVPFLIPKRRRRRTGITSCPLVVTMPVSIFIEHTLCLLSYLRGLGKSISEIPTSRKGLRILRRSDTIGAGQQRHACNQLCATRRMDELSGGSSRRQGGARTEQWLAGHVHMRLREFQLPRSAGY